MGDDQVFYFCCFATWEQFRAVIQQLTDSMRQMPCGSSNNVQEFKVILMPVPTVPAVSNVPLLRSGRGARSGWQG